MLDIDNQRSIELIHAYIKVRDCYYSLKDWENEYLEEAKDLRETLNAEYDFFVKEYGNLTDSINILNTDSSFPEVRSLELNRNGQLVKADIFYEPTAFTKAKDVYSPEEALTISLNKFNAVDLAYISKITGKSEDQLINVFEDKIYLNPETNKFEPANVYISGNVYKKLDYALNAFQENNSNRALFKSIDALQKAIPEKIQFEDIGISLGERWIPNKIFSSFASEIFEGQINVSYNSLLDDFNIDGVTTYRASEKYSVKSHNRYYGAIDVLRFALLDNIPELTKKIQNGDNVVTVPDSEGIQKMNASVSLLQEEFSQWLHKLSPDVKTELENTYNHLFNCFIKPSYNGSWQTFPGLNKDGLNIKDLYDTQKNAILLVKNNGGGIIDHEVGGGKTLIMCVSAFEMKRLGLANKPCILGLKANISQIADTFKTAYPDANVLCTTKDDLSKENREEFFNKIQNNNWDCIIMTHEQYKAIPQSLEIQKSIIEEEVQKIEEALYASKNENSDVSYKKMEAGLIKRKQNLEVRLNNIILDLKSKRDNIVDFKTMGIDHLFVDESHKFKNLMFQTRHQRVAGLGNSAGSERSLNLLFGINVSSG